MGKTINLKHRRCKQCSTIIVPEGRLSPSGKCRACSAPGGELALAASMNMESIVRDVVEASVRDWARSLGRKLEPKQKEAWDRLNDLEKAVKALPTVQKDTLIADHLKARVFAATKDARRIISAGDAPKTRIIENQIENVIEYFKEFLSPLRDIGYAHDPQLRSGLDAIKAALPPALDAIRAIAA